MRRKLRPAQERSGKGRNPEILMTFASLAEYRQRTIDSLTSHYRGRLRIYAGSTPPGSAIRSISTQDSAITPIPTHYLPFGITIQVPPVRELLRARVVVADLNPRMPVVWAILIARRALSRPVALWGHAFPRAGEGSRSDVLRDTMRRLAPALITYTRTQAAQLSIRYPEKLIVPAPNALYFRDECSFEPGTLRDAVIYVGRLTAEKKPLLLIHAFERVAASNPDARLLIVGDGPLHHLVKTTAERSPSSNRIHLLGHITDPIRLRAVYSQGFVSVSPGYAGLSLTQSLSFGVPMLIASGEPHAPEIEAAHVGENCLYFAKDDVADLAYCIEKFWDDRQHWATRGAAIAKHCADSYSVEAMVEGVRNAIAGLT